jgi:hypothetical protein
MEEKAGTGTVRVATLNLWGRRGVWDERRRVLAEGFRELGPDLVAFQEAIVGNGQPSTSGKRTSPRTALKTLGWNEISIPATQNSLVGGR